MPYLSVPSGTVYTVHRVYGAVSAGRDAPYLASDVPPVWKHGYVPLLVSPLPLRSSSPLSGVSIYRHGVNPPTRPRPYRSSTDPRPSLPSATLSLLPLRENPITPLLSITTCLARSRRGVSFSANLFTNKSSYSTRLMEIYIRIFSSTPILSPHVWRLHET